MEESKMFYYVLSSVCGGVFGNIPCAVSATLGRDIAG
jgi:hypothetical protein